MDSYYDSMVKCRYSEKLTKSPNFLESNEISYGTLSTTLSDVHWMLLGINIVASVRLWNFFGMETSRGQ